VTVEDRNSQAYTAKSDMTKRHSSQQRLIKKNRFCLPYRHKQLKTVRGSMPAIWKHLSPKTTSDLNLKDLASSAKVKGDSNSNKLAKQNQIKHKII